MDAFGGFSDEPTCLANAGTYGDRTLTACENAAASAEFGEPFTSAVVPVALTECAMPTIVTKTQVRISKVPPTPSCHSLPCLLVPITQD